ncbi:MAG TPA: Uma2 family endonuclease [Micromonosporaceae bacterium]|nr:Uma2 family endonuclease [Micromonosporaceae bacterium]
MSAEAIPVEHGASWQPDPVRQRLGSYTLEDVLNLPPDAPRVELVDGVMLVVPSPTEDHQDISFLLCAWLRRHAPKEYKAIQALGVAVEIDRTYEPDVLLIRAGGDGSRHFVTPDQVIIAIEVVTPRTRARDRISKPAEYAAAGIPYYWRVEQNPVHVFAYRLGPHGRYELAADSTEMLELDEPFPIKLPIAEITP